MRLKVILLIILMFFITLGLNIYSDEIVDLAERGSFLSSLIHFSQPDQVIQGDHNVGQAKPLEYLYVTILENDPVHGYSFQEMTNLGFEVSIAEEPRLAVLFQTGSEQGPEEGDLGYGLEESNATIEQRGNSARSAILKSYKIRLRDDKLWSQNTINLNKHNADHTRVRNKLSFDYLSIIPDIPSLHTQFVRLYIKDLTLSSDADFVDYGLFTHVEQLNTDYLRRQLMDPDGYLYKAEVFEFYRYPDILRDRDDPLYDKDAFEQLLSIRGREYHDKLLSMLDDLNNESLDINKVVEKHFNIDNMLTWFAVNLIMGNRDSSSNNFFLYSPLFSSNKWYFLPWDYDGTWNYHLQWDRENTLHHPFRDGLSLYSGWPWARRYFQDPNNLQALNDKIESLEKIITKEQTKAFLDEYYSVVRPLVLQMPDVQLLPGNTDYFDIEFYSLSNVPKERVEIYYDNLQRPVPIFIGGPWIDEEKMNFTWWESYDYYGNDIFYDLKISETPDFSVLYYEQSGLQQTSWTINSFPTGTYYWTVTVRNSRGDEQIPYEGYIDWDQTVYHGVKSFTIE